MPSPTERSLGLFAFLAGGGFVAPYVTLLYRDALFPRHKQAYHDFIVRVLIKFRRE
ncbi:conserved protein of unknown function [Pseudomonas sp. JV551A1]|uniref:Uncharacterized protein n=1 Tax=Pseudomonas inefficax TaxID=2078786 RepID=A0AAQ1SSX7_9PSED|nr:conserved protein of unknown function [Pseudomonas sp. JV551A1]SPO60355.1 conserved protein of unknown function [Pseudomonas inefficax]